MLAVENESLPLKCADYVSSKILESDVSIPLFHGWNVHHINTHNSTRFRYPMQTSDYIIEVFIELFSLVLLPKSRSEFEYV